MGPHQPHRQRQVLSRFLCSEPGHGLCSPPPWWACCGARTGWARTRQGVRGVSTHDHDHSAAGTVVHRDSSRADIGASFTVTTFATGLNWPLGMVLLDDGSILVSIVEGTCLGRLDVRRRADGSQQVPRRSGHRSNRWELPPRRHRRASRTGSPPTTGACAWEAQFFLEEFDGDCEELQDLPLIRVCQPCIINLVCKTWLVPRQPDAWHQHPPRLSRVVCVRSYRAARPRRLDAARLHDTAVCSHPTSDTHDR